jgi:hypothetical protein
MVGGGVEEGVEERVLARVVVSVGENDDGADAANPRR